MSGEEEKEEQFLGWMQQKPKEAESEEPTAAASTPASGTPGPEERAKPPAPPAEEPKAAPAERPVPPRTPEAVPTEEPRLLAAADRPYRHLRGAFWALIALFAMGLVLWALAYFGKLNQPIAVSVFLVLSASMIGGVVGILLGDLLVQPSSLSRFIAVAISVLIGYLSGVIADKVKAGGMHELVEETLPRLLNPPEAHSPFVVKLVLVSAVFGLAIAFLLGFLHAVRPRD
jgi:hypothetical protein